MTPYDKILIKKDKAVSIFAKTKSSLLKVCEELKNEQTRCDSRIESYNISIKEEEHNKEFLQSELDEATRVVENIDKIFS